MIKKYINFKVYLSLAIIFSLGLTVASKQYEYFFFDLFFTQLIQGINWPVAEELLKFITWMGNFYPAIFSLIIVSGAVFIYGYRKESLMITFSTLGAVSISETLKLIISRPRPDLLLVKHTETFFRADSFPSGHVLFFIGFYGFLLFLAFVKIKKRSVRNLLVGLLLGLIILVGISRIYLGSHWFSDVLAAYLIGSVWFYTVILIYRRIEVK